MFYGSELNISKTLYYLLRYCRLEPNLSFYYSETMAIGAVNIFGNVWRAAVAIPPWERVG